jgi:hypothetical protein
MPPGPSNLADDSELIPPQKPALRLSLLMHLFCNTGPRFRPALRADGKQTIDRIDVDGLYGDLLALRCAGSARIGARFARRMFLGVLAALRLAVLTPEKSDLRHRRNIS